VLGNATEPFTPFQAWFDVATRTEHDVADAMQLATADAQGRPSVRTVLLKRWSPEGFVFFTNYGSRKSQQLEANPWASGVLHWKSLQRQVILEGRVTRTDDPTSDAYFSTRDRRSQLGAWASEQSAPLESMDALAARLAEFEEHFADMPVPRPPGWGGWRIAPDRVEFWQGRPNRLHERILFVRDVDRWDVSRLNP
jgi:pyridoxamine 5'-phosphate oxidase